MNSEELENIFNASMIANDPLNIQVNYGCGKFGNVGCLKIYFVVMMITCSDPTSISYPISPKEDTREIFA